MRSPAPSGLHRGAGVVPDVARPHVAGTAAVEPRHGAEPPAGGEERPAEAVADELDARGLGAEPLTGHAPAVDAVAAPDQQVVLHDRVDHGGEVAVEGHDRRLRVAVLEGVATD